MLSFKQEHRNGSCYHLFRFSQQFSRHFHSSLIWCCIIGPVVPLEPQELLVQWCSIISQRSRILKNVMLCNLNFPPPIHIVGSQSRGSSRILMLLVFCMGNSPVQKSKLAELWWWVGWLTMMENTNICNKCRIFTCVCTIYFVWGGASTMLP